MSRLVNGWFKGLETNGFLWFHDGSMVKIGFCGRNRRCIWDFYWNCMVDEWEFSMTSPRDMGFTLCESYTLHIYIYMY